MNAVLTQVLATLILSIPNSQMGFNVAWCSYTIPTLESDNSPLLNKITQNESRLMGSVYMLGCLVTAIIGGYISDSIGRKRSEIACGICLVVSWLIITTATSVTQILIGRFISGIGAGLHCVVQYVFLSEFADISIRGALTSMLNFGYCVGVLVSYTIGWLLSYQAINCLSLITSIIHVCLASLMKETPGYLLSKGRYKQAQRSLKFYRGTTKTTPEILEELSSFGPSYESPMLHLNASDLGPSKITIDNSDETDKLTSETDSTNNSNSCKCSKSMNDDANNKISQWKILLSSKSMQRATVTIVLHIVLTVMMGVIGVQTYAGTLFRKASPTISPHVCSIIAAAATLLGAGLFSVICHTEGRRILMIFSCALSCLSLMMLASLLRWSWAPEWAVPAVVLFYSFVFQLGAGGVPFIQMAESFVPEVRSLASTISMCSLWIANFVVLAVFGPLVQYLGLDGTFVVFSVFGAITTATSILFIKETKGVSLEVIYKIYGQGYLYREKLYSPASSQKL